MNEAMRVIDVLLWTPETNVEFVLSLLIVTMVFAVVFNKLSKLLNYPLGSFGLAVLITALTALSVVVFGVLAVRLLAHLPLMKNWGLQPYMPVLGAVVAIVLVMAPAMRLITSSRFGVSLVGLLLSAAASAAALALFAGVMSAVRSEDESLESTRKRTRTVNEFLTE